VTSQRLYIPSYMLAADDQLEKWKGRGKHKRKIQRKADKTGLLSWELVDEHGYCIVFKLEHVMSQEHKAQKLTEPKNQYYLRQLLSGFDDCQHVIIIDEGTLGGYENAKHLQKLGHKFIMICTSMTSLPLEQIAKRYRKKKMENAS